MFRSPALTNRGGSREGWAAGSCGAGLWRGSNSPRKSSTSCPRPFSSSLHAVALFRAQGGARGFKSRQWHTRGHKRAHSVHLLFFDHFDSSAILIMHYQTFVPLYYACPHVSVFTKAAGFGFEFGAGFLCPPGAPPAGQSGWGKAAALEEDCFDRLALATLLFVLQYFFWS